MLFKGLTLDKFQEDAINAIEQNYSVVVSAPTGSGKTLAADYIIEKELKTENKIVYTAPIKALSNQKYKDFARDYGKENIGLLTGDTVINPGAPVLIMTTEVYRNIAISGDQMINGISYVIFDEIHYINDIERGYVWEESVIFSPEHIRFLCLSATIPNAKQFADWIKSIKGHEVTVVEHDERPVKLKQMFYDYELGLITLNKLKSELDTPNYSEFQGRKKQFIPTPKHTDIVKELGNNLPCLFFCFSRLKCEKFAKELAKKNPFQKNAQISKIISQKMSELPKDINNLTTTKELRQVLPKGIGFHHAGLLPGMKDIVETLFAEGLLKVLYTTETFAVGINMPAKTTVIESVRKFDGISFRRLNTKEYFQIAGRAGRRGIDTEGLTVLVVNRKEASYNVLKKLTTKDSEPIKSQFQLSVNTVLNLYSQHTEKEIQAILNQSFMSYSNKSQLVKIHSRYDALVRRLKKMQFIENNALTNKGIFASKIYCDEIILTEIFGTDFCNDLSEYQTLLILACLVYEEKSRKPMNFYKIYPDKESRELIAKINSHPYLKRVKRLSRVNKLTGLAYPLYNNKEIFSIIKNTEMPEGMVFRLINQISDRLMQLKNASNMQILDRCLDIVDFTLKDINDINN